MESTMESQHRSGEGILLTSGETPSGRIWQSPVLQTVSSIRGYDDSPGTLKQLEPGQYAIGPALYGGSDGRERPVIFFSRKLFTRAGAAHWFVVGPDGGVRSAVRAYLEGRVRGGIWKEDKYEVRFYRRWDQARERFMELVRARCRENQLRITVRSKIDKLR